MEKRHVLVRLADSCRIETTVISEGDTHWEAHYNELVSNGWRHNFTREV